MAQKTVQGNNNLATQIKNNFATFTLNLISCLRCSSNIFRSFQQFRQYWIALCLSLHTYFYIR